MTITVALIAILFGTYGALGLVERLWGRGRLTPNLRGRVALALLFAFTGLGHFVRTGPMAEMLPSWVPARHALIILTGVLEWAGAVGVLLPGTVRAAGTSLFLFLLAVFPANVYAAFNQVAMGGHEAGPLYLLIRGPLQLLFIGWTYWFTIRPPNASPVLRSDPPGEGPGGDG